MFPDTSAFAAASGKKSPGLAYSRQTDIIRPVFRSERPLTSGNWLRRSRPGSRADTCRMRALMPFRRFGGASPFSSIGRATDS
jgi:hypothetical protein